MAAIGSAVNEMREAQTLMTPVMLMIMIPWMLWMPITPRPELHLRGRDQLPAADQHLRHAAADDLHRRRRPLWQVWLSIVVGARRRLRRPLVRRQGLPHRPAHVRQAAELRAPWCAGCGWRSGRPAVRRPACAGSRVTRPPRPPAYFLLIRATHPPPGARWIAQPVRGGHRSLLAHVVDAHAVGVGTVAVEVGVERAGTGRARNDSAPRGRGRPVGHRADVPVAAVPPRHHDASPTAAASTRVSSQTAAPSQERQALRLAAVVRRRVGQHLQRALVDDVHRQLVAAGPLAHGGG